MNRTTFHWLFESSSKLEIIAAKKFSVYLLRNTYLILHISKLFIVMIVHCHEQFILMTSSFFTILRIKTNKLLHRLQSPTPNPNLLKMLAKSVYAIVRMNFNAQNRSRITFCKKNFCLLILVL